MQLHYLQLLRDRFTFVKILKVPGYRRYYIGMVTSVLGSRMILDFGLGWLIFDMTRDARYIGYMGAAIAIPTICFTLFGGVFADKLDPRRLVGVAEGFSAVLMGVLGILVLKDWVEPLHVIVIAILFGAGQAFDQPARNSMYPRLIQRQELIYAVSLNSLLWTGTRIIGPAAGGYIVGRAGFGTAGVAPIMFIGMAGLFTMALLSQTLHLVPVERASGNVVREMQMGFKFIKEHNIFLFLVSITFINSVFGMSYILLMPVFAREVLLVGEEGMGWLLTMSGVGAVSGIIISTLFGNYGHRGYVMIGGAVCFGSFVALFGLSHWYVVSMVLVFLAGMSNSFYLISVMTTLQTLVPNEFRGRVMGVYSMTYSMIPLGALQAGFISDTLGPDIAVAMGGIIVVTFALFMGFGTSRVRSIDTVRVAVT